MAHSPRLILWLEGSPQAQLSRTFFYHPLIGQGISTCRGRTSFTEEGTFTWSAAVKGLCMLMVGCYAVEKKGGPPACLTGGHGSLAASLDYALSKKPCWLQDMFGVDSSGRLVINRLLLRRNPERKRSGPVDIFLNPKFLPASHIQVIFDGRQDSSLDELEEVMLGMDSNLGGWGRIGAPHSKLASSIVEFRGGEDSSQKPFFSTTDSSF